MYNHHIKKDLEKIISENNFSVFRNSTVLITGSSGFIGKFLFSFFDFLNNFNYNIQIYAQYFTTSPNLFYKTYNLHKIRLIQGDISNYDFCQKLPTSDFTFHTAGYAQPKKFLQDNLRTLKINSTSTYILLEKINIGGAFLFLSSSEVYSGCSSKKCKEEDIGTTSPLHERAAYIEGKRSGEVACKYFYNDGYNVKTVRLGDIYGPGTRQDDQRAISDFIRKGIVDKRIRLMDSGSALRSFTYISDAVEWMLKCLLWGKQPVYNIGSDKTYKIYEIALEIGDLLKVPVYLPKINKGIIGAPKKLMLDLSRLYKEFPKKELTDLHKGLIETIKWNKIILKY